MVELKTNPLASHKGPDLVGKDVQSNKAIAEIKAPKLTGDNKALHTPIEVKKIDDPALQYQKIFKAEEVDALEISEQAKKNLKWLLTKHGLEAELSSEKDFISVHVNPEGKAIIDMAGQRADKQLFRRSFIYRATSWFTGLFSRVNWGIAAKYARAGSGINVADPTNKEAKLEPASRIFDGLRSGRYSVSASYDLNSANYKQPEAVALYDQFGELLEQMKANLPKNLPDAARQSVIDEINKFESQGLDGVCVCSTVLLRDDMKEKYAGEKGESAGERQRLLAQFGVTNSTRTTLIFPSNIFMADFASAKGHIFEKMRDLTTIEMTEKGPQEVAIPAAEVIRKIEAKNVPIPADAFAKVFALHKLNEMISNPSEMTEELAKLLTDIQIKNKTAVEKFNEKISLKDEAKTETKVESEKHEGEK